MTKFENSAFKAFAALISEELTLAQVLIRRAGAGFELRHVDDKDLAVEALRIVPLGESRKLAQFTSSGEFRPLKSAPTLQRGWRMELSGCGELELALNTLYPGAVADWYASRSEHPPVTDYSEFTGRQSGMYRVTAMLEDAWVADVVRSCCNSDACLKQRLWRSEGAGPDKAGDKSIIPCLEPCAILLESARKAWRAIHDAGASTAPELAEGTGMG